MSAESKATQLTNCDRLQILADLDSGHKPGTVASKFKTSTRTIQRIKRDGADILKSASEGNLSTKRSRLGETGGEVDQRVFEWFVVARGKNIPINGPLIQQSAVIAAAHLNVTFAASNGWLEKFKKRHNISSRGVVGDSCDMDVNVVNNWMNSFPQLAVGYEPKDIFNCDETGLFRRALPSKTLAVKGEACKGGKGAKERITLLLTASATGEKLKPFLIGSAYKPRCFKGNIPFAVHWRANKKAWMTAGIFGEYLELLDEQMRSSNRHILLLMDNAPVHLITASALTNIKVVFLPPNTTAGTQPLDAGIIKNFKDYYRKSLLTYLVNHPLLLAEDDITQKTFLNSIDMSMTIKWVLEAWGNVKPQTIINCFRKCGVTSSADTTAAAGSSADTTAAAVSAADAVVEPAVWSDDELRAASALVGISDVLEDNNVTPAYDHFEDPGWEERTLTPSSADNVEEGSEEAGETEDGEEGNDEPPPITIQEACNAWRVVMGYLHSGDTVWSHRTVSDTEKFLCEESRQSLKATKITDFFSAGK